MVVSGAVALLPTPALRLAAAMRASAAVFCDLSRACEGLGLADFNSDDFQLQVCVVHQLEVHFSKPTLQG